MKLVQCWVVIALVLGGTVLLETVQAAVGCTLRDPDRDIRKVFPEATGYKTDFVSIQEAGGKTLATLIEKRLGEKLNATYEALDVPYAYYTVLKGKTAIGYVHGVNQKGRYGGMQLILATSLKGKVLALYYQKLSSPESGRFRAETFTEQFKGLVLADFVPKPSERVSEIKDPSKKNVVDFNATLRAIKKNLILLDVFKLNRKHDNKEDHDEGTN